MDPTQPAEGEHAECIKASSDRIAAVVKALADHQEPCAVNYFGHRLPTKVVVVAEYIDEKGERDLTLHATEGITSWEVGGMLSAALGR